ncbi:MAG: hypothetical protein IT459_20305 [Planctomycetes bacterium]|nr:hypothetical protein [Planctomycetota bacterium]
MAASIRLLVARRITNDEFEALIAPCARSADRVIGPLEARAWTWYSDTHEHSIDRWSSTLLRPEVARWVLFLQTDVEYRWPPGPRDEFRGDFPLLHWITGGWSARRELRRLEQWERHGEIKLWPFLNRSEFDAAKRRARFLVGPRQRVA